MGLAVGIVNEIENYSQNHHTPLIRPGRGRTSAHRQGAGGVIRVGGHLGEWMQGRLGTDGPVALISLPCPDLVVTAVLTVAGAGLRLHSTGPRILGTGRASRLLRRLGLRLGGRVVLRAEMPVGGGAGASTAALVALARLAGWDGDPLDLARACIAVEGASDPLMLPDADRLLWASRRGEVLAVLPPLPDFDLIGGFQGPPQRTDPLDSRFADISDLVGAWQVARHLPQFAALATDSARRTLLLRRPQDLSVLALGQGIGALGTVIAHTGSARGFIFPPGALPPEGRGVLRRAGWTGVFEMRRRA